MTKIFMAVMLTLALVFSAAPAQAAPYYGDTARAVATSINCTPFKSTERGTYSFSVGNCRLKGRVVTVVTFRNAERQALWHAEMRDWFPKNYFWAEARGAAVGGFLGTYRNARVAAHRLVGGRIVHGTM